MKTTILHIGLYRGCKRRSSCSTTGKDCKESTALTDARGCPPGNDQERSPGCCLPRAQRAEEGPPLFVQLLPQSIAEPSD